MRFSTLALLCLVSLIGLAGCDELEPNGHATTVGPEGALIRGSAADGVPVTIDIAPGALAEATEVSIALGDDATPLPPGAFAVGLQVRLEPVDTAFAMPIQVTVPVDDAARAGYGVGYTGVKVWQRDPESDTGWAKLDPIFATETSATVELERFDTVVAGVKLEPGQ